MPRATKTLSDAESMYCAPIRGAILRRLAARGLVTLGDLCETRPDELRSWKNIGPASIAEIRAGLAQIGRTLREDDNPPLLYQVLVERVVSQTVLLTFKVTSPRDAAERAKRLIREGGVAVSCWSAPKMRSCYYSAPKPLSPS